MGAFITAAMFLGLGALAAVVYSIVLFVWSYEGEDNVPASVDDIKARDEAHRRAFRAKAVLLAIVIVAMLAGITVLVLRNSPAFEGTDPRLTAFFTGVVYFAVMLLGMTGEYVFGLKKWSDFNFFEFQRPLWVSFIVFGSIWSALDKGQFTFTSLLACYQNGFFWKTILRHRDKAATRPRAKRTPV